MAAIREADLGMRAGQTTSANHHVFIGTMSGHQNIGIGYAAGMSYPDMEPKKKEISTIKNWDKVRKLYWYRYTQTL